MTVDVRVQGDIEVLRLRDGDRLVFTVGDKFGELTDSQIESLQASLQDVFPDNPVLVLCGMRLKVARP